MAEAASIDKWRRKGVGGKTASEAVLGQNHGGEYCIVVVLVTKS